MVTKADIRKIQKIIKPLLGKQSWGASLGYASFITIEFGNPVTSYVKQKEYVFGEWHLWVYCCAWYLEKDGEFLAASGDERPKLEVIVPQYLDKRVLHSIKIVRPAFETIFTFDEEVRLHIFPTYTEEYKHWMLHTPEDNVVVIGPGTNWSYESASAIPSKDT